MSRFKIDAFVIRTTRMTESSRVLTLYSKEMGKIKGVAKGVGRPKSKLGGVVELFNLIEGDLYKKESSDLGVLGGASLLEDFRGLTDDPRKFGFASAWCEVLDKTSHSEEPHPETFDLTFVYFKSLQEMKSESSGLLFWSALMKFIMQEGYAPSLDNCISCDKDITTAKLMVSLQRGGLICGDCVEVDEPVILINHDALELLRVMESVPLSQISTIRIDNRTGRMAAEVILSLATYHLGLSRNLKSFKFIEDLTNSGRMGI
jgi:DNA repair protein RecO (recombination protein O)